MISADQGVSGESAYDNKMTSPERPGLQSLLSSGPLLVVAAIIILTALGGESARLALRYDNAAIASGQWWRLLSGHLVHLGWQHLLLNLTGLVLVMMLFPREYRAWQWSIILLASIFGTSAGFLLFRPDLVWYVGLSGVLHGLFLAGAVRWIARGEVEGYLLLGFLVAKLLWEQFFNALPFSVAMAGGAVIVDAHLYGAVIGTLAGVVFLRDWRASRR
ncbi:MAG: rhombosortase [Gammaproteobacteria bacterium]|nr:rhombosortase [Gammaproteobacteria bacterium]NNF67065.1 rhombosortase [Gammaproteobacteria bacterium]